MKIKIFIFALLSTLFLIDGAAFPRQGNMQGDLSEITQTESIAENYEVLKIVDSKFQKLYVTFPKKAVAKNEVLFRILDSARTWKISRWTKEGPLGRATGNFIEKETTNIYYELSGSNLEVREIERDITQDKIISDRIKKLSRRYYLKDKKPLILSFSFAVDKAIDIIVNFTYLQEDGKDLIKVEVTSKEARDTNFIWN